MRRLLRRRSANDRHLKLLALTDRRKSELNRNETAIRSDDQRLPDRGTIGISRLNTSIVPHPNSRATLAPTRVSLLLPSKDVDIDAKVI
jgi:hypothetical protein